MQTALTQSEEQAVAAAADLQHSLLQALAALGRSCDDALDRHDAAGLVDILEERRVLLGRVVENSKPLSGRGPLVRDALAAQLKTLDDALDRVSAEDLARFERMTGERDRLAALARETNVGRRAFAAYGGGTGGVGGNGDASPRVRDENA